MSTRIVPTADMVRSWAQKKGLTVADAGRLPFDVVEAYNKAHKVKYESALRQPARLVKLTGTKTDKAGRPRSKTVTATFPEIRAWAVEAGYNLGERGRIPADVLSAYADQAVAVA